MIYSASIFHNGTDGTELDHFPSAFGFQGLSFRESTLVRQATVGPGSSHCFIQHGSHGNDKRRQMTSITGTSRRRKGDGKIARTKN